MRNLVASRVPLGDLWFLVAAAQGIEYCLRPAGGTAVVLNAVERAMPFWGWGICLLIPSVVGLVANRLRYWGVAIFAHIGCAAVYAGLTYGLIAGVVQAHQMWGWQLGPPYLCFVTLHGLWAVIDRLRDRGEQLARSGNLK